MKTLTEDYVKKKLLDIMIFRYFIINFWGAICFRTAALFLHHAKINEAQI